MPTGVFVRTEEYRKHMSQSLTGLKKSEEFNITIYADDKLVKEIDSDELEIGVGRMIILTNLWVSKINFNELKISGYLRSLQGLVRRKSRFFDKNLILPIQDCRIRCGDHVFCVRCLLSIMGLTLWSHKKL